MICIVSIKDTMKDMYVIKVYTKNIQVINQFSQFPDINFKLFIFCHSIQKISFLKSNCLLCILTKHYCEIFTGSVSQTNNTFGSVKFYYL